VKPDDLWTRHPGVSFGLSQCYWEAAQVCLDRHHPPPKVTFKLEDNANVQLVAVSWTATSSSLKSAWANKDDTTEAAAYCLALGAIEQSRGLVAVSRAETRTGADYYLSPSGSLSQDLEAAIRIEISGMDRGTDGEIQARLSSKVNQAAKGKSNLPAIASVVGFAALKIVSKDVPQE